MKKTLLNALIIILLVTCNLAVAQQADKDQAVEDIIKEATENSQLERLAHELVDVIGPRLVGTPQMQKAHDWAVETYGEWGIPASNEQWGEWRGWEIGITHVDLVSPRVVSLEAMQLAWSPGTSKEGITAGLVIIPDVADSIAFR